jgi:hypothetical protein
MDFAKIRPELRIEHFLYQKQVDVPASEAGAIFLPATYPVLLSI